MQRCDKCGNPSEVTYEDLVHGNSYLCLECNNKMQAEKLGIELPELTRHHFCLTDCEQAVHVFDSEYMITPVFKTLRCFERGPSRYKCEVMGKLNDDYDDMFKEMMRRLRKMLSSKYMQFGTWADYNIYGYISHNQEKEQYEIIIDGKPYTWEELSKGLHNLDGFQIRIETARPTVDFEREKELDDLT